MQFWYKKHEVEMLSDYGGGCWRLAITTTTHHDTFTSGLEVRMPWTTAEKHWLDSKSQGNDPGLWPMGILGSSSHCLNISFRAASPDHLLTSCNTLLSPSLFCFTSLPCTVPILTCLLSVPLLVKCNFYKDRHLLAAYTSSGCNSAWQVVPT